MADVVRVKMQLILVVDMLRKDYESYKTANDEGTGDAIEALCTSEHSKFNMGLVTSEEAPDTSWVREETDAEGS